MLYSKKDYLTSNCICQEIEEEIINEINKKTFLIS